MTFQEHAIVFNDSTVQAKSHFHEFCGLFHSTIEKHFKGFFFKTSSFQKRSGFTLVEVLISLLVMGLAISGLLDLLHWGQVRYESLARSPGLRMAISDLRRAVRNAVTTGKLPLEIRDGRLVDNGSASNSLASMQLSGDTAPAMLRIASISLRPYGTQSVFVKLDLFEDRNHDNHAQPGEKLQSPVWCFRMRDCQ